MWKILCTAGLLLLTACATTPEPVIEVRTVNVAMPVLCKAAEPQRPEMPLDALRPGAALDQFVAHALAEREVRESYEQKWDQIIIFDLTRFPPSRK